MSRYKDRTINKYMSKIYNNSNMSRNRKVNQN